jgi:quercetin dioxygenase-like cupin family protein
MIASELLAVARTAPDGKASRTLLKGPDSTVVVVALLRGARMAEHSAPSTVVIVPLVGQVTFASPTADSTAQILPTQCLFMGSQVRHDVLAEQDSAFMLIFGGAAGGGER